MLVIKGIQLSLDFVKDYKIVKYMVCCYSFLIYDFNSNKFCTELTQELLRKINCLRLIKELTT